MYNFGKAWNAFFIFLEKLFVGAAIYSTFLLFYLGSWFPLPLAVLFAVLSLFGAVVLLGA
jgi:pilus assembly protein TadC